MTYKAMLLAKRKTAVTRRVTSREARRVITRNTKHRGERELRKEGEGGRSESVWVNRKETRRGLITADKEARSGEREWEGREER